VLTVDGSGFSPTGAAPTSRLWSHHCTYKSRRGPRVSISGSA
jgi:hypothetical protein